MVKSFKIAADGAILRDGWKISSRAWAWVRSTDAAVETAPSARAALASTAKSCGLRHLVVGVIGPRDASDAQYAAALEIGRALGALDVTTICGGKSGVMEAVCKGVDAAGGLAIGVLPGHTPEDANSFVGVPLPTGLSEARNMVIAKAARVLIAVGGSYGTLTEVAYGLHFSKAVIGLESAPQVDGVTYVESVDQAIEHAAAALIASARPASEHDPWPEQTQ